MAAGEFAPLQPFADDPVAIARAELGLCSPVAELLVDVGCADAADGLAGLAHAVAEPGDERRQADAAMSLDDRDRAIAACRVQSGAARGAAAALGNRAAQCKQRRRVPRNDIE